ncbi:MAG: family 10 glycosylhydrolase [Bacteroidetes bacterium]|nr:family 10 glycosylhydrolase [Bacteroidota bacterium]
MKKACLVVALLATVLVGFVAAKDLPNPETQGVWISENYLTGGPTAIESMIETLSAENVNVIYVEVYSHGSTIYPSTVMSNAGGILQNQAFSGTDPLKTVIQIAHRYGIEVFAWFASPFLLSQSGDSTQVPPILVKHPDWAAVQRDTTKHFFPPHGAYGYSFEVDPCVPAAADFIVNLETECARNYPDIDGIETDIENDTTGWYGDTTRALFMQETGNPDPLTLPDTNSAWLAWRSLQVTNVVKRIYEDVKQVNPQCVLSAAVDPPYYGVKLESWGVWAKDNYVDILEPMVYLPTAIFDSQWEWCLGNVPPGFQLSAGVAINSAGSVANAIYEMQDARQRGTAGIVVWYYGYLFSYADALTDLKSQIFTQKTLPSYDDLLIDSQSEGRFRTTGAWTTESGGYGGAFQSASAVQGDTAIYSVRILRSGDYTLYGYWAGDSSSNCPNAIVQTSAAGFVKSDTINEKEDPSSWSYIDKFQFASGDTVTIKLAGAAGGNLIADAFRLRRGTPFILNDYAVPDSQSILLKFSAPLLAPMASITSISASPVSGTVTSFVYPLDNTILHVSVPPMQQGVPVTLKVTDLLDVSLDTLSFSQVLAYDPDSTMFVIDDGTPNSFWKLSGNWQPDTGGLAVNGSYWVAKQGTQVDRVRWGPLQVESDGYYDVYAHIPKTQVPLSSRCLYVVTDEFGADSIYASQASGIGTWMKLGNLPFTAGSQFAPTLSSIAGSDTGQYLAADAVMLVKSVEFTTAIKSAPRAASKFRIYQNYPNPFNPQTIISFELGERADVNVSVYNVLGQRVSELIDNKTLNAGTWNVRFGGSLLPSGLYFGLVTIKGSAFESRKILKMLLLK